jgi:hypothetical protein
LVKAQYLTMEISNLLLKSNLRGSFGVYQITTGSL